MSTEKSGWDKIAEQEANSVKKENTKEKLRTAAETTSSVSWVIVTIASVIAIAAIVLVAVLISGRW